MSVPVPVEATAPLVEVRDLVRRYTKGWLGGRGVTALNGVSLCVNRGETMGLVGESGSGKSTTGRVLLGLERADEGAVFFDGTQISGLSDRDMKPWRRRMQAIFQDPYGALNPRRQVGSFIAEPLLVQGICRNRPEMDDRVATLLRQVGLDPSFMRRYPHEFSGGQRQRLCIARALALGPEFIVADEPITALDVSIQAQIVNLFQDLRQEMGLSYLFISHDLSMIRYLCHRVAVMLRGRIVELAPTEEIFSDPRHSYTRSLLSAIPIPDPERPHVRPVRFNADANVPDRLAEMVEVTAGHFVLEH
ncbi:ABC transporter ATP-binding protein [Komagataeibacter sp. SM21]|uniref:ABC transporter ATP-binding protein n=1 Tax=Komagataeibacter sp. SM21 TaxID=3242899 RepID=UPI0035283893